MIFFSIVVGIFIGVSIGIWIERYQVAFAKRKEKGDE